MTLYVVVEEGSQIYINDDGNDSNEVKLHNDFQ